MLLLYDQHIIFNMYCYFDFSHRVLRLSSGIEDMGPAHWDLSLSLLAAWVIAFFCMVKGIKSSGKVIIWVNTSCWNCNEDILSTNYNAKTIMV